MFPGMCSSDEPCEGSRHGGGDSACGPGPCEWQTAHRQWCTATTTATQDGLVPGLRAALVENGMSSFVVALEAWCDANGAAFLGEIEEEVEQICQQFRLPSSGCRRLRRALATAQSSPSVHLAVTSPQDLVPNSCKGSEGPLSSRLHVDTEEQRWEQGVVGSVHLEQEELGSSQRTDTQGVPLRTDLLASDSAGKLQEPAFRDAALGSTTSGAADILQPLRSAFDTPLAELEASVPGLTGALVEANLVGLVQHAEAWCLDTGAAFLVEVLEEFDNFCATLGLDCAHQLKLRSALQVRMCRFDALDFGKGHACRVA